MKRFIDEGADLVTYSGGKAIRGPQATGIICGDRDLIASIAMQTLDMDEHFEIWDPPEEFIPQANKSIQNNRKAIVVADIGGTNGRIRVF